MGHLFDKSDYDQGIAIIGGGASGLMAAVIASSKGAPVRVFDRNTVMGAKILATGNGRCNFTNTKQDMEFYHSSDLKQAGAVLGMFDAGSVCRFFHDRGVLTVNKDGWIYPKSQTATTIRDTLTLSALRNGVKLLGGKEIQSISREADGTYRIHLDTFSYRAKAVILAAGGSASGQLGTRGDGVRMAQQMGLKVKKPLPALVPLTIKKDPLVKASGVRIAGKVTICNANDKKLSEMKGQLQLTDYGISGIPVFGVSQVALRTLDEGQKVYAKLDFLPECSLAETADQLKKTLDAGNAYAPSDTKLAKVLTGLFPEKLAAVLLKKAGEYERDTLLDYSRRKADEQQQLIGQLAATICAYRVEVTGSRGFEQAQTTSGGVLLSELDTGTMMDENNPGLFLCGEVLDVDGVCGGYNLQWAFSSGYLAGVSSSAYIRGMDKV